MDNVERIIAYEMGELSDEETVVLFQALIDSGQAWTLQGSYGRMAAALIAAAPDMYEALKGFTRLDEFIRRTKGALDSSRDLEHWFRGDIDAMNKALAKAESLTTP